MSGWQQWWPARIATPPMSRICATSCGWMPSMLNETIPARFSGGGPYSVIPGTSTMPLQRVLGQLVLPLLDRLQPGRLEVVHRRAEADRLGDRLRPGLELRRHVAPGRLLERDLLDHVAAEVERLHLLEQLELPQSAPTLVGPQSLCAEKARKSAAERLDVDAPVRRGLCGVDHRDRARSRVPRPSTCHRVDGAERVGDEVDRDHA